MANDWEVVGVGEVDARAVASADVVSLTVERGGVDGLEEHLEDFGERDDGSVVADVDGFGIASCVGIYLLVGGIGEGAVGIAGFGMQNARKEGKIVLGAPEAAASEVDVAYGRTERGIGVGEDVGQLFETEAVGVVEGVELSAVDVEDTPDGSLIVGALDCLSGICEDWDDNLAAGLGAAGDVARELLDIGDDDGAGFFPGGATDTLAVRDVGAGDRTLEGGENEFVAGDAVEARPPESEGKVKERGGIGEQGSEVDGVGGELGDLLDEKLVLLGFRRGGVCIHRFF